MYMPPAALNGTKSWRYDTSKVFKAQLRALICALWLGALLALAAAVMPSAFAVLEKPQAGLLAQRLFAIDAYVSLVLAAFVMQLERKLAGPGQSPKGPKFWLAALALACTVLGYFGLQDAMQAARVGHGYWSFGALHAASSTMFGVKLLAVAGLAWLSVRELQPSHLN